MEETEPDEMVPLRKILHLAGADWTYGSKGWGGENYWRRGGADFSNQGSKSSVLHMGS